MYAWKLHPQELLSKAAVLPVWLLSTKLLPAKLFSEIQLFPPKLLSKIRMFSPKLLPKAAVFSASLRSQKAMLPEDLHAKTISSQLKNSAFRAEFF